MRPAVRGFGPVTAQAMASQRSDIFHRGYALVIYNPNDCAEDTTLRNPDGSWAFRNTVVILACERSWSMKRLLIALPVLCLATLLAAGNEGEKKQSDKDLILGKWKVVSWQSNKEPVKDSGFSVIQLEFTTGIVRYYKAGAKGKPVAAVVYMYELDASKETKRMSMSEPVEVGDKTAQVEQQRAVYSLDGDVLKLCWSPAALPYPTKVEPGDMRALIILKRETKAGK